MFIIAGFCLTLYFVSSYIMLLEVQSFGKLISGILPDSNAFNFSVKNMVVIFLLGVIRML